MSSEKTDIHIIHPLIAAMLPGMIVYPLYSFLQHLIEATIPSILFPIFFGILAAICAVFFGTLGLKERFTPSSRIRELSLLLLFVWLFSSPFNPGPFIYRYTPGPVMLASIFSALFHWVLSALIQNKLRAREQLKHQTAGLIDSELQSAVRDTMSLARYSAQGLRYIHTISTASCFFSLLWLLIAALLPRPIQAHLVVFCLYPLLLRPVLYIFTASAHFEQQRMGEGIRLQQVQLQYSQKSALLLVLLSLVVVFVLSSNNSLIPQAWVQAFVDWLSSFLEVPETSLIPEAIEKAKPPQSVNPLLLMNQGNMDLPGLKMIGKIMGYALFAVLFASILRYIVFLIAPLLTLSRRPLHLAALRQFFISRLALLKSLFNKEKFTIDGQKIDTTAEKQLLEFIQELYKKNKNARYKRSLGRMTKAFLLLTRDAAKIGLVYKRTLSPLEYCTMLTTIISGIDQELLVCGRSFESALYSGQDILQKEEQIYMNSIRIIKQRIRQTFSSLTPDTRSVNLDS